MKPDAAIANVAWFAASLPEWRRFRHAASNVEATQRAVLADYLRKNAATEFGELHDFRSIPNWETYAARVPLRDYDDFAPWIRRIATGAPGILTAERVELLEPSSGSSGPEKWVPYTGSLQAEFRRAVAVWIAQNFIETPGLLGGRGYWSLTPQLLRDRPATRVPVGFDDDTAYLGGATRRLIERTLVTTPALRRIRDMPTFWRTTLILMLGCRDLRLISVWHPSYLTSLLGQMRTMWQQLLADFATGLTLASPALSIPPDRARAAELERVGPDDPGALWPDLRLISCWGDGHAATGIEHIRASFPRARVQPKGLIATEAFVTLALGGLRPLAVRSHFFEFVDDAGRVHPSWALERRHSYAVVVTSGGGLYRYRLRDRVEVDGYYHGIPSLCFLGKEDNVCDFYGEKLSEAFVATALDAVLTRTRRAPAFAMLAMDKSGPMPGYTLYIECSKEHAAPLDAALEIELRQNPHYDLCVRIGQIRPLRVECVANRAFEIYSSALMDRGMRLGDIKPTPLSRLTGWSSRFSESVAL